MGKFILTEQEKQRIKSLYEQGSFGQSDDKDYTLVANKNPFKYQEFKDARKTYSNFFKGKNIASVDGEMYYVINSEKTKTFLNEFLTKFYNDSLVNKTVRGNDDKIYTIKNVQIESFPDYFVDNEKLFFRLFIIFSENNSGACLNVEFNPNKVENCPMRSAGFNIQMKYPYWYQVELNQKIINSVLSNPPKISRLNIPDDFFEIRKIQKTKTDFQP